MAKNHSCPSGQQRFLAGTLANIKTKTMRQTLLTIFSLLIATFICYGQEDVKVDKKEIEEAKENGEEIIYERPFNAFISAGINVRIGDNYNVAISPVDNTVQFEKISPLNSGVSTGLVWNPFTFPYKIYDYKGQAKDWHYEYKRHPFAIALLMALLIKYT